MLPIPISRTNIKTLSSHQLKRIETKLSKELKESLDKLSRRIEKELPERGNEFAAIEEKYPTKGGTVTLKVSPSTDETTPDKRIFKVVFNTHNNNSANPVFELGTKRDIQRMLSDRTFMTRVQNSINTAKDKLKKNNLL